MKIQSAEPLSKHTTFRIGGPALFYAEATSVDDLKEAVAFAREKGVPFIVLGEGSNVLMSDTGFEGLVVRPLIRGIEFGDDGLVTAGAGEHWDDLVAATVACCLSGLENLSYIPGSVGAAPVQNIGAYGAEIKNVLEWVEVFDPKTLTIRTLSVADCRLGYRNSLFKSEDGRGLIVTRLALRLTKKGKPNISYKDLAQYFAGKNEPSIAEVREVVIEIRKKKLPDVDKLGTAGSFFKNPIISEVKYNDLAAKFPGLPSFAAEPGFKKIPLAWVLDKVCKLNGHREGNVGLYEKQPLALVNFGGATFVEVENLAMKIAAQVKEKTGVEIEWEVVRV